MTYAVSSGTLNSSIPFSVLIFNKVVKNINGLHFYKANMVINRRLITVNFGS